MRQPHIVSVDLLRFCKEEARQRWDNVATNAESFAKVVSEGKPELLTGLHQAEHGVARNAAVTRHRSAGDFSLEC